MKTNLLDRRTLLRGAGVTLALPPLEAMMTSRGALVGEAAAAPAPVNLVTYAWACGCWQPNWIPKTTGPAYQPTPSLAPIAPVRQDITVITGMVNTYGGKEAAHGDAHSVGLSTVFAGSPGTTRGSGGPTVDTVAAEALGRTTPIRLLALAIEPPKPQFPAFNFASYTASGDSVPTERDPVAVYQRLFSSVPKDPEAAKRLFARRQSVLDVVKADIARLKVELGSVDKSYVDQHFESVRAVEKRLEAFATSSASCKGAKAPDAVPDPQTKAKVMTDLFVLAMKCDLTRYGSFLLQNAGGGWDGLHGTSHRKDPAGNALHTKMTADLMAFPVYFANALKSAPHPAGGTLLDRTLVVCTSEVASGHHTNKDHPVLLIGHGGGVKGGQHLRFAGRPLSDLYATLLTIAGVPTQRFGKDGTGTVTGLV
jgi:hypothetical protein